MQKVKLGEAPQHGAERDAIHVAVYPTCAAVKIYPGQHVGHGIDGATPKKRPIGIVDPFLNHPVMPGEKFWIVLFPDTARALRHDWKHPDVDSVPVKLAGEAEVTTEFTVAGTVEKKSALSSREESTPGVAPPSGDPEVREALGLRPLDEKAEEQLTKPRYARYASLKPPEKKPEEEPGVDGIPGWTQKDEDEHQAWCNESCPHEPDYTGPRTRFSESALQEVPVEEVPVEEEDEDGDEEEGD